MKVKISAPKIKLKIGTQKIKPNAESLEITPSKDAQSFQGLYDNVSVSGDENLVAENIKKDVSIFGVEGSYEPEIKLQNKNVSITENGTQIISADNGYDGLQEVDITVNVEGEPNMIYNQEGYSNYAGFASHIEELKNIDLSSFNSLVELFKSYLSLKSVTISAMPVINTSMNSFFDSCASMVTAPYIDTTMVISMQKMFSSCTSLVDVPIYNTSSIENLGLYRTFSLCPLLSNQSLNNIMRMCINATGNSIRKSLKEVGLTQSQAETCMTLPNYQAFLDAGWTTGY